MLQSKKLVPERATGAVSFLYTVCSSTKILMLFSLILLIKLFIFQYIAIQAELILGTIARKENAKGISDGDYLDDRVTFSEDKIMDSDSKAIMMAWEKPLMEAHAKAVCSNGGHILNIGFGMGLVDTAIQQYAPLSHTIVEAHPEVYDRMMCAGWGEKENVKIIFGRWQDVISKLESYDGKFPLLPFLFPKEERTLYAGNTLLIFGVLLVHFLF